MNHVIKPMMYVVAYRTSKEARWHFFALLNSPTNAFFIMNKQRQDFTEFQWKDFIWKL